ncbi:MAG: tol-pal system YbgF family protein [Gammaproteobacteria bacterium]
MQKIGTKITRTVYIVTITIVLVGYTLSANAQTAKSSKNESRSAVNSINLDYPYAINIQSSLEKFVKEDIPELNLFKKYRLYTTTYKKAGKKWYRLRLGFFPDLQTADKIKRELFVNYPRAWIDKTSKTERKQSIKTVIMIGSAVSELFLDGNKSTRHPAVVEQKKPDTGDSISEEKLAELMEVGRQAMAKSEYAKATQIYTKILQYPNHKYLQDAQEFLGLSRERRGQIAHAKAEYRKYLELYPEGPGADRVKQRLAGLLTARKTDQKKLRAAKSAKKKTDWDVFGSFSQFYRRDTVSTDDIGNQVNQSSLSNDVNVSARRRINNVDLNARFAGGYEFDFLSDGDNETRISSLYINAKDRKRDISGRLGRQSSSTGGVLGRFDGMLFNYEINNISALQLVTGFPVETSSQTTIATGSTFYGFNVDLGTFQNKWDFNGFAIEQTTDNILDRRAIGGEVRYFKDNLSFFGVLDYDISYSVLNTVLINGNWTFPDNTTFNFVVDQRKSPILTTSNALQGQTSANNLKDLLNSFTEAQIRSLAEDRSADSQSYTFGLSRPIDDKLQLGGDLTISNYSGTPASGGVDATEGSGTEYYVSGQIIGTSLIKEGDLAIAGLRYSDTSNNHTTSFTLNTRYPIDRIWRINPRLRIDYKDFKDTGGSEWTTAPSIRVNYRYLRRYHFEFELGTTFTTQKTASTTSSEDGVFISAGYRADF